MNDHDFLQQLDLSEFDPFSFHLQREAALQFYERSLTSANPQAFKRFIREQVLHNPLHVELLYEISGDLQQRLTALQEYYLDTRQRVLIAISERYNMNVNQVTTPGDPLDYHTFHSDELLLYFRSGGFPFTLHDYRLVGEMLKHSLTICTQLDKDIKLTEKLLKLLRDWMMAGCVSTMRQRPFWMNGTDGALRVQ